VKILRKALDKVGRHFEPGRKLQRLSPVYEMLDTFLYTPGVVTRGLTHIRDSLDQKRLMITVAIALLPAVLMACYNTGFQANAAISSLHISQMSGWRIELFQWLGMGFDPMSHWANFLHGVLYFLPVYLVTNLVGGLWEVLFSVVRKHAINEGFLVTGILFPLILPPTIPLWQVALGISFAVVLGKEVFGGTGTNFLNPALTARAFLFFSYPRQMAGDMIWVAASGVADTGTIAFSGATPLAQAQVGGIAQIISGTWSNFEQVKSLLPFLGNLDVITAKWTAAFLGFIPGSMGETSALAALIGAASLIFTGIGSFRIMVSVFLSTAFFATILNLIGSDTNKFFDVPFHWHAVLGGWAFGLVFMATDPVSAAMTETGKYWYGILIGFMVVLIRVINPAFPEGTMLAILFANVFAPSIDFMVVRANISRRRQRSGLN
jgi:Na+-transporting NADH:ubiquinone oxidoreductase subunit B